MVLSENSLAMIEMTRACNACSGGVEIPYTELKPAPTMAAEMSDVVTKEVLAIYIIHNTHYI